MNLCLFLLLLWFTWQAMPFRVQSGQDRPKIAYLVDGLLLLFNILPPVSAATEEQNWNYTRFFFYLLVFIYLFYYYFYYFLHAYCHCFILFLAGEDYQLDPCEQFSSCEYFFIYLFMIFFIHFMYICIYIYIFFFWLVL